MDKPWLFYPDKLFAAASVVIIGVSSAMLSAARVHVQWNQVCGVLLVCGLLLALSFAYRNRIPPTAQLAKLSFWLIFLMNLHLLPMYAVGRIGMPYQDAFYASLDRMLGIEIPAIYDFLCRWQVVSSMVTYIYPTLMGLMVLSVLSLGLTQRYRTVYVMTVAIVVSAILGFTVFALAPSEGPTAYYGIAQPPTEPQFRRVLAELRGVRRHAN